MEGIEDALRKISVEEEKGLVRSRDSVDIMQSETEGVKKETD